MAFSHQWPVTSMIVMSSLKILRKMHDKVNEFLYTPNKLHTLTVLHLDLVFNSFDKINYLENFQETCDFNRPQIVKAINIGLNLDIFTKNTSQFDRLSQEVTQNFEQSEMINTSKVISKEGSNLDKNSADKMKKLAGKFK